MKRQSWNLTDGVLEVELAMAAVLMHVTLVLRAGGRRAGRWLVRLPARLAHHGVQQ